LSRFDENQLHLMFRRSFVAFCLIVASGVAGEMKAQTNLSAAQAASMRKIEDSLVVMVDSMYNAFIPDTRIDYCQKFTKQLVRALKTPNSFSYNFDTLGKRIGIITTDDKAFRIFNWLIVPDGVRPRYFGAVQMNSEDLKLYPLFDHSTEINKGLEDSVLSNQRWYGALYYRILTTEADGEKVYTLFGLNANSLVSNTKVLDPMRITENGVEFGAPVFNVSSASGKGRVNRFVMEYKKGVQASLNWDDELKLIYFDRLVSQANDANRKYTYVPSGQYDGFRWVNGKWTHVSDLIPVQEMKDGDAPTPRPLAPKD
jgi:hypothetical protein